MQRARAHRLGLTGVRTLVFAAVTTVNPERVSVIEVQHAGTGDHTQCGQSGRDKVEKIVHFCRKLAEILVFIVMIADHGIQRVDRLVQHAERCSADEHEHERRDHTVRQVFSHGLDSGLDNALLGQLCGVAADVPRDGLAPLLERLLDRAVDMITGVRKAFSCENHPAEQRFGGKTEPEVHMIQTAQKEKRHGKAHAAGDEPEYNPSECQ